MNKNKVDYGVPVWVRFGQGKRATREKGIILDFTDAAEGDYYWTKVELIKENPLSPGQVLRQIYPQPIQSYQLSARQPDQGETIQGSLHQKTRQWQKLPSLVEQKARLVTGLAAEHKLE